jgi:hypothetical protein
MAPSSVNSMGYDDRTVIEARPGAALGGPAFSG